MRSKRILQFIFIIGSLLISMQSISQGIDYRMYQSKVSNQGFQNTCTSFAVCNVLELFPGVPANLSEQYIYSEVVNLEIESRKVLVPGKKFSSYINTLSQSGVVHETQMPYNPMDPVWKSGQGWRGKLEEFNDNRKYIVPKEMMKLMNEDEASDIGKIKSLLEEGHKGIIVSYYINVPHWDSQLVKKDGRIHVSSIAEIGSGKKAMPFDEARAKYKDLHERIESGKLELSLIDQDTNNFKRHAVIIVGYNEEGFIVRNSWGKYWGEEGYGYVDYDYHKFFCKEALLIMGAVARGATEGSINMNPKILLKSQNTVLEEKRMLSLTVFSNSPGIIPDFEKVTYSVSNSGGYSTTKEVMITPSSFSGGYEAIFEVPDVKGKYSVSVSYRFKGDNKTYTKVFDDVKLLNEEYF